MATFGFVHGAYHGAWCWGPLTDALHARGHQSLTVDLPTEDPTAGATEYAAAAADAFAAAGDDLIVVGHSLAGLSIPLLPAARPVARLVYLCAMLPRPGLTQSAVIADEPDMIIPGPAGGASLDENGAVHWDTDAAGRWFFADCMPEQARWASAQLRGQYWPIVDEVTPLTAWPDVATASIIGTRDNVIGPEWSRRVTRGVLGVDPIEIDAGHSPFLSATEELADLLVSLR
jgi:hypothetical protein